MSKPYDLVVYIGRFQPVHVAHIKTIQSAAELSENVLVLIGSAKSPRTIKNPFSYEDRKNVIKQAFSGNVRLSPWIRPIVDYKYDETEWIRQVGSTVNEVAGAVGAKKIAVIGHDKDSSSYYLNYFPQWDFIEQPAYPEHGETIDATKIRRLYFEKDYAFVQHVVPIACYDFLMEFSKTDDYKLLEREYQFVQDYKKAWAVAPYEPTFVTTDAVVVQSGHVLLIRRGSFPGYGQWAMPGGFLDPTEKIEDGVIRELREETKLKVPDKVLKGSITDREVFDSPDRSSRGRTITHAFTIKLDDSAKLPKVKGSDDAMDAKWVPLSDLENMQDCMYEDHFDVVNHMLNRMD